MLNGKKIIYKTHFFSLKNIKRMNSNNNLVTRHNSNTLKVQFSQFIMNRNLILK